MSDGPVGGGTSYFATFQISGDLDEDNLKAVVAQIRTILDGNAPDGQSVDGQILSASRTTGTVTFSADGTKVKQTPRPKIIF